MTHRALVLLIFFGLCLLSTCPSVANDGASNARPWVATWTSAIATVDGAEQLRRLALRIARMPQAGAATTLAARVSPEGHWTFVNMAGETFTAANAGEIKRGTDILLPDAGGQKLLVILTSDSVFERASLLQQLPKSAQLELGWDEQTFGLSAIGSGSDLIYLANFKPNIALQISSAAAFSEAMLLLPRPLERRMIRVLKLEPAGPRTLPTSPRVDVATGRADIDAIDPAYLASAIGALAGQTAVIVGRTDRESLVVRLSTGADRALPLSSLRAAADAADVDLVILKSSSGQQPGGRNWLWQRLEVKGLDKAMDHPSFADFFDALGSTSAKLKLNVEQVSANRTTIDLVPLRGAPTIASTTSIIGSVLAGAVAGITGTVEHEGALAYVRSASRKTELDRRFVPYIPSPVQRTYGVLLLLGILGAPISWSWWGRLWPDEKASDYPKTTGLYAARAVRAIVYAGVFMPLAALAAAIAMIGVGVKQALKYFSPVRT